MLGDGPLFLSATIPTGYIMI